MDLKLMKDFEELEGIDDMNNQEIVIEDDEDDSSFRPANAYALSSADLYYEMEKRSLKSTGFPEIDKDVLQKAFDEEFKRDLEEIKAKRRETKRRQAQQEGLQKRRLLMEKTLQEEQTELARDYQVQTVIELIKENLSQISLRIDVNSVSARSLAKAMWANSTITCLDLSSNNLNDHAGSYLARILKRNRVLLKIELDNNFLGNSTCKAFGEALLVNNTLRNLSLDSNPLIGKENSGFCFFAESLKTNKTLVNINLWRTCIDSDSGAVLASCVEENDNILFCDIGHNSVELIDQQRIVNKLDMNLSSYEAQERLRRKTEEENLASELAIKNEKETMTKKQELSKWLEDRRELRAENRRAAEIDRVETAKREALEKKRLEDLRKEAERKAAAELAEKKAKAAAKKKK